MARCAHPLVPHCETPDLSLDFEMLFAEGGYLLQDVETRYLTMLVNFDKSASAVLRGLMGAMRNVEEHLELFSGSAWPDDLNRVLKSRHDSILNIVALLPGIATADVTAHDVDQVLKQLLASSRREAGLCVVISPIPEAWAALALASHFVVPAAGPAVDAAKGVFLALCSLMAPTATLEIDASEIRGVLGDRESAAVLVSADLDMHSGALTFPTNADRLAAERATSTLLAPIWASATPRNVSSLLEGWHKATAALPIPSFTTGFFVPGRSLHATKIWALCRSDVRSAPSDAGAVT